MSGGVQRPVVVIGSGLAGIMTALQLAPTPVLLLTQGGLGQETSSMYAQGGIAAASEEEKDDSDHVEDTLTAGAGLCDLNAVHTILGQGKQAIAALENYGVVFDHDPYGHPRLGLEGGHSHRRIFHIHGDATGKGILEILSHRLQAMSSVRILENAVAVRLLKKRDRISGLVVCIDGQRFERIMTSNVVLATGGIGGLFVESTNPLKNYGQGLILAAEAGAVLADLEFVQFHPTGLDVPVFPSILVSEAVRGEGAVLVNGWHQRFLVDVDKQELAPRDVVARAIYHQIDQGEKVYLDARKVLGKRFSSRFPSIYRFCQQHGIDPGTDLIPVKPVEHFHMGGVVTTLDGETSVPGLWAVGEVASTGLHGANRLASNSLLEATVMAIRTAKAIILENSCMQTNGVGNKPETGFVFTDTLPVVKKIMQENLNIIRDGDSLRDAIKNLLPLIDEDGGQREIAVLNPAKIALMIAVSAMLRKESRGAHYRQDYPRTFAKVNRSFLNFNQAYHYATGL